MNELVIDHYYRNGMAWDTSEYRNHGLLHAVENADPSLQPGFSFARGRTAPGSTIVVPPSQSLSDIGALRVRVMLFHYAVEPTNDQVLIEGDGSFSVRLDQGNVPVGVISTGGGWAGIRADRALPAGAWVTLEFWYDGFSMAGMAANGEPIASSATESDRLGVLVGAVPGVGPRGVFIGHAAQPDDSRTLFATLRRVQVYKRDDLEDLRNQTDPCCTDATRAVRDLTIDLLQRGYTRQQLDDQLRRFIGICSRFIGEVRGTGQAEVATYDGLARQVPYAMRHAEAPLGLSLLPFAEELARRMRPEQLQALAREIETFIDESPFSRDQVESFAEMLCMNRHIEEVQAVAETVRNDPSWQRLMSDLSDPASDR